MTGPSRVAVFLDLHNFANQRQLMRRVELSENVDVSRLIPPLVTLLSLPVVLGGVPLVYHLCFDGGRLDTSQDLASQGVAGGCTLTVEVEYPEETPLAVRIRTAGLGNVRWHCFLSHGPCAHPGLRWDPTLVPVFLSADYAKSTHVWDHTVLPAVGGLQLCPERIQARARRVRNAREGTEPHQGNIQAEECPAISRGRFELHAVCRAAQQGMLSVVDLTGADAIVVLALGMLWGCGHPVILLLKEGAHLPLPVPPGLVIGYKEPGEEESIGRIRAAIQQRTGITAQPEADVCHACGERFASEEKIIVCIKCHARYHT